MYGYQHSGMIRAWSLFTECEPGKAHNELMVDTRQPAQEIMIHCRNTPSNFRSQPKIASKSFPDFQKKAQVVSLLLR
jgi:hypothetical protein